MNWKQASLGVVGLFAWAGLVQAQNITLLLNSKTIDGIPDGGSLNSWAGEVGSAATPGSLVAPTYHSSSTIGAGIPGVRFSGNHFNTGMGMGMVTSLTQNAGAYTVMAIYNHNDTTDADGNIRRVLNGGDGVNFNVSGPNWLIGPYVEEHRHFAGNWVTNPGPSANTGPALVTAINTGIGSGTSSFFVDGTNVTTSSTPNGGFNVLGLGAAGRFGEAADSDVGLVLVFDGVLDADQRTGLEFILAEAFGLQGFSATDEQFEAGNALLVGTTLQVLPPPPVPEPSSIAAWLLMGLTAFGLLWRRRTRRA